jgi:hypothetical protein
VAVGKSTGVADTVDVEDLTTELYTSAPEDFVKVRGDGVKRLKAAGQSNAAAAFAKLAKPSASAWAVDLLAAQRPAAVAEVVSRGDDLRRAHTGGAGAKEIRAAHQARQDAIRTATDAAVELTGRDVSESHRGEIAATLEAASADSAVADEVRAGRLARPLPAPSGFDLFGGLTVIAGGRAAPPRAQGRTTAKSPAATSGDDETHRARADLLRADAAAMAAEAEAAETAAGELRDRVDSLQEERDRVDDELRRLERELTSARRELRDAERAAAEAERKASRAVIRAERAEE